MTDVAVVGAGAVGLTLAGRLAQHGAAVTLFEASDAPERIGSRAICMQRETLEIWARLGVGEAVAERGIQWHIGRTYFRGRELFSVDLPGATDEHFPPFVNISQSEVEEGLTERARRLGVEIRHGHQFIGLTQDPEGVTATFATANGEVTQRSSFLAGTDGAHSAVRHAIGVGFAGYTLDDRFLIADIRADLPFTNERHFHFDPPWNPGRQVLIHPQPDGIWRIDWQVPSETDADAERANGGMDRRIRAVIGERTPHELVWVTGYRFSQRVADAFRTGRVFLAGDAAHVMSPFGARGLNSGVADAENLAWKLASVVRGDAPPALLDTYEAERRPAALSNLRATEATMRFMAPHGALRRAWRDIVLRLAPRFGCFRRRVDSGRLAEPAAYAPSSIVAEDPAPDVPPRHGSVAPDVELPGGGRLRDRLGSGYVVVVPRSATLRLPTVVVGPNSLYGDERAWLVRPDGYVADSSSLDRAREHPWRGLWITGPPAPVFVDKGA
jgi:2-polyprenyl-6-methoxyphenol hydroxylase-like FAD-dependent oxidoreductase